MGTANGVKLKGLLVQDGNGYLLQRGDERYPLTITAVEDLRRTLGDIGKVVGKEVEGVLNQRMDSVVGMEFPKEPSQKQVTGSIVKDPSRRKLGFAFQGEDGMVYHLTAGAINDLIGGKDPAAELEHFKSKVTATVNQDGKVLLVRVAM